MQPMAVSWSDLSPPLRRGLRAADMAARDAAKASGFATYTANSPCNKGHLSERYVSDNRCIECNRLRRLAQTRRDPKGHSRRNAAWVKANPEFHRAQQATRRARKKGNGGKHTQADINRIYAEQEGRCKVCAADFLETGYHVDHVVPLAAGGSNGPENLQLLCPTCNVRKGAKPFGEFLMEYMF